MKKLITKRILIIVALVALIFVTNYNNVFAAINEKYYEDIKGTLEVNNENLDATSEQSVLLDAIAILVYVVGSILEKILGSIFQFMSGDNIFPWADAILFNAIPMLDINIFNPSNASIMATLKGVLSNVYWTVFSLALSFFGIAVMVTAIKLAVSTIASDKALYKQAIVKWLMGFVTLCGIHFFMSFAMYLNEQLVIEAQYIASDAVGDTVINIDKLRDTKDADYTMVYNFVKTMLNYDNFDLSIFTALVVLGLIVVNLWNPGGWVALVAVVGGTAAAYVAADVIPELQVGLTRALYSVDQKFMDTYDNASDDAKKNYEKIITDNYGVAAYLLKDSGYTDLLEKRVQFKLRNDSETGNVMTEFFVDTGKASWKPLALVAYDVWTIMGKVSPDKALKIDAGADGDIVYIDMLRAYVTAVDYAKQDTNTLVKKVYEGDGLSRSEYYVVYNRQDPKTKAVAERRCNGDKECKGGTFSHVIIGKLSDGSYMIASQLKNVTSDTAGILGLVNYDTLYYEYAKKMVDLYDRFDPNDLTFSSSTEGNTNIISSLANAFKKFAWENTTTSWRPTRVTIEGALLYSILVAQSLIFFISYAKRLFYVIILILMAPVVVVFDFFTKFSS